LIEGLFGEDCWVLKKLIVLEGFFSFGGIDCFYFGYFLIEEDDWEEHSNSIYP